MKKYVYKVEVINLLNRKDTTILYYSKEEYIIPDLSIVFNDIKLVENVSTTYSCYTSYNNKSTCYNGDYFINIHKIQLEK